MSDSEEIKKKYELAEEAFQKTCGTIHEVTTQMKAARQKGAPASSDTPSKDVQLEILQRCRRELQDAAEKLPMGQGEARRVALKTQLEAMATLLEVVENCESTLKDNRKTHFQEAGQWGRHYSTVRMTVLTFSLTTCAALTTWNWQTGRDVSIPVGLLWLIGVLTFWIFTFQTYDRLDSQLRRRPLLPDGFGGSRKRIAFDWASLAVPVVNAALFLLAWNRVLPVASWWLVACGGFAVLGVIVPCGILAAVRARHSGVLWLAAILAVALGFVSAWKSDDIVASAESHFPRPGVKRGEADPPTLPASDSVNDPAQAPNASATPPTPAAPPATPVPNAPRLPP